MFEEIFTAFSSFLGLALFQIPGHRQPFSKVGRSDSGWEESEDSDLGHCWAGALQAGKDST